MSDRFTSDGPLFRDEDPSLDKTRVAGADELFEPPMAPPASPRRSDEPRPPVRHLQPAPPKGQAGYQASAGRMVSSDDYSNDYNASLPPEESPVAPARSATSARRQAPARAAGARSAGTRGAGPRSTTGPDEAQPRRRPKKHSPVKRFFTVVGLLVLAWVVFTVAVPIIAWNRVATVNDVPDGDRPGDQPGTTILLVGSDSRQGMSEEERDELGTGDAGGQRADTMMIYYIPPSGAPALISLPRDSFVAIPGNGENKLNAAYAFGGPQLLVHTVEQATGLRIDGYLEIGFAGFANLVDAVGGVEVCLDEAIQDTDSHLDLPAGCQTLDGVNALAYVRMRKADPTGDIGRIARQREILSKVAQQAMSPATILNPIRWQKTCFAIAGVVTHGEDTGLGTMGKIALSADNFVKGDVISMVVPISNPGATTSAGSSVLWDDARAQDMFSQIASGDTSQLDQFVD